MTQPRRSFLRYLALGGGLALTRPSPARGGTKAIPPSHRPKRFISVFMPHGMASELWRPKAGFSINFENACLAPFDEPTPAEASLRDRILVLEGFDLAAGIEVGTAGHNGARVILTGSGAEGRGPSLDQYLARELGLSARCPHSSLVLAVGDDSTKVGTCLSYARGGAALPKLIDPGRVYASLFGGPISGHSPEQLAFERQLGRSALDSALQELQALKLRVGQTAAVQLEQHWQSLRDIERRMQSSPPSCGPVPVPDRGQFPKLRVYGGGEPYFDAITDLLIELMVRAMACDLTRVATLVLADTSRSGYFPRDPVDIHEGVAHRYQGPDGSHPGVPSTWPALARQNRYSYSKVAKLMQRLRATELLDDTLVHASSDMGDPGRHSSRQVPTVLGGAKALKMGRYMRVSGQHAAPSQRGFMPNNRLLVAIAQLFGAEIDRFGSSQDPSIAPGTLQLA